MAWHHGRGIPATLTAGLLLAAGAACAGDPRTPNVDAGPTDPPAVVPPTVSADYQHTCDPAYEVRLQASFGGGAKAFTEFNVTFTASVRRKSDSSNVSLDFLPPPEFIENAEVVGRRLGFPNGNTGIAVAIRGDRLGATTLRVKAPLNLSTAACGSFAITVESGAAASITATPTGTLRRPVDQPFQLGALVYNQNGTRIPQSALTLTSTNPNVATTSRLNDSLFVVTPVAQGTTTIRAAMGGAVRDLALTVCAASTVAQRVVLTRPNGPLGTGTTHTLTAFAYNCVDGQLGVSWRVSDPSVATIASQGPNAGRLTPVTPGSVWVTAYNGAAADSTLVSIRVGAVAVQPSIVGGMTHLSWTPVPGATRYRIYRMCAESPQYVIPFGLQEEITGTQATIYDEVSRYGGVVAALDPPYFGYYVVGVDAAGNEGAIGDRHYFQALPSDPMGC